MYHRQKIVHWHVFCLISDNPVTQTIVSTYQKVRGRGRERENVKSIPSTPHLIADSVLTFIIHSNTSVSSMEDNTEKHVRSRN
jgi:hypothetical protein